MSEYGESRSQDKRLAAQGKPQSPQTSGDRLDEMREAIHKLSSEVGRSPHDSAVQDILFSILEELTELRKATERGASA